MTDIVKPAHLAPALAALVLTACATSEPPAPPKIVAAAVTTTTRSIRVVVVAGSERDFETNAGDTIHFDYDRYALRDADKLILQKQAAWLKRYPAMRVTLEGYADERGTREYNLALGARRATAAKDYLAELGIPASRVDTVSYGKDRPICTGSAEPCWQINRRAVTALLVSPAS